MTSICYDSNKKECVTPCLQEIWPLIEQDCVYVLSFLSNIVTRQLQASYHNLYLTTSNHNVVVVVYPKIIKLISHLVIEDSQLQ